MTFFRSLRPALLAAVVLSMSASCGTDSPDEGTAGAGEGAERPYWQLQAGDDSYEGDIALVKRTDGRLRIQLVNQDAVNLAIQFPDEGAGAREVEDAYFVIERGQPCRLVSSDPPFQATLEAAAGASLKGTLAGFLACSDYSSLQVQGWFRIPSSGD